MDGILAQANLLYFKDDTEIYITFKGPLLTMASDLLFLNSIGLITRLLGHLLYP